MKSLRFSALAIIAGISLVSSNETWATFTQQGPKLVVTGGFSIALSADGNTAIVGGPRYNSDVGGAWVYTRSGGVWTQQGTELVSTSTVGHSPLQGYSVALSADGNTAIVGGPGDDLDTGAAWIYTRIGNVWTESAKLVDAGAASAFQGQSVGLSADGNTAIVGGPEFHPNGAAWVYTRIGGVWTQQGPKLVGTGAVAGFYDGANQGWSVALSADGNTAIVGGPYDNSYAGATWVYSRTAGVWTQQGAKLVGTGAVGSAGQGGAVALSANGNTAVVGGSQDAGKAGAAWVYTRTASAWTQQGPKLVGTGAVGGAWQGQAVAVSGEGNTAIVGGPLDNLNTGAAWVFTRSGGTWAQQGAKLVGTGALGPANQGQSVAISGDGNTAIVGGPADKLVPNESSIGAAWVYTSGPVNYQGLWWAAPAGSESGWGINFAHQGDVIFATWFTYDATGKEWWLSMSANKSSSNPDTFTGQLIQTHGPAFSAVPFNPTQVTRTVAGNGTLTFTDANNGSFAYSVNTTLAAEVQALVQQNKAITRQVFGTLPTCNYLAQANPAAATNYTDLWWASPGGSESGWGINLTHQGTNVFATWFTYDTDGTPLWLSASLVQGAGQTFSGALIQTAGPAFNSVPFDPTQVTRSNVGAATLSFTDGNTSGFDYTAKGVTQHKAITRQLFNPPAGTVCQ
jgi:hypothetical protein